MIGKWERRYRAGLLVLCCLGQAGTAVLLAYNHLWWMAGGQLATAAFLLTYAYEARKRRRAAAEPART